MTRPANWGRLTCESCLAIDVREWKRRGLLRLGQMFPVSWNRAGVPCGSISVRTESDAVVLIFRSQHPGETEWKSTEQRVPILWTACHLGGRRHWFRCAVYSNGQYCGRRVAVLYAGGDLFACRHCYGLRQPAGEPAKSIHQALAKHQNAARWQSRPATALSEKAAWNAPVHVHAPSGA